MGGWLARRLMDGRLARRLDGWVVGKETRWVVGWLGD